MKFFNTHFATVFILVFFAININAQCLLIPTALEQRLSESELLIEGKVIDQYSFWGVGRKMIYTANEIEVYKVFKGNIQESTIEIISTGGTIDNQKLIAHPSLKLRAGQTGVFILKQYQGSKVDQNRDVIWWPVAVNASFLDYGMDMKEARDIFERTPIGRKDLYRRLELFSGRTHTELKQFPEPGSNRSIVPVVTSFSPDTVSAGIEDLITITGTGFGATEGTVVFLNANNGGMNYIGAHPYHIQTWTDTEITVWIPSNAGTGTIRVFHASVILGPPSADTLTIEYNTSNLVNTEESVVNRTYLIDDMCDGDGGYKFMYSTNTANNGVDFTNEPPGTTLAQEAFERALSSWQDSVGFSAFAGIDCGTDTIQVPGNDSINIISFDSDAYDLDVEQGTISLGLCCRWYSSCGPSEEEVTGIDLIFRRDTTGILNLSWEFGPDIPGVGSGDYDFESICLHELGHGTQLEHVIDSGSVMHYSYVSEAYNRTLGPEDIAGANDVEAVSVAYNPLVFLCNPPPNDFNCARQYAVYDAGNDCAIGPLPVELLSFDGKRINKAVELNWETASEVNNDFFTLERSIDGRNFETIAIIQGAGNSYENQLYRYFDNEPALGLNYYRLSQTDFDGTKVTHDKIISVNFLSETEVQIRPNPVATDQFQLAYHTSQNGKLEVEIYSITGTLIFKSYYGVNKAMNYIDVSIPDLSNGVYIVKTKQKNTIHNLRFVKA